MELQHNFTTVYFIRHGQSISNVKQIISGNIDDPQLTELGVEQVNIAGQSLWQYKDISYIVSSNMTRTNQTALTVNKWLNKTIKFDQAIQERSFGIYEGKSKSYIKEVIHLDENNVSPADGESRTEFNSRVTKAMCKYFFSGEKAILLASHGYFGLIAHKIFYGSEYHFHNAETFIFDPAQIYDIAGKCAYLCAAPEDLSN